MKKKIFNYFLVAVMLLTGMSTFVACKDYDEDSYNELKAKLNSESTARAALEAQLAALKQQVAAIKSCECDLTQYLSKNEASLTYETKTAHEASIALLQSAIDKINTTLGYVDTSKGTVADQLSNLNLTIIEVQNLAEKAIKLAEEAGKCKCDLTPIKESIKNLEESIAGWNEELQKVNYSAQKALADIATLEVYVKNNYATKEDIQAQEEYLKNHYATKEEVEAAKNEALAKAEEAYKLAKEALNKVAPDYSTKIAEMDAKINDFINEYKPKIDKLAKEVAVLENTISTIENKVNSLLNDVLKKQITGVIVQATECPVIGYLNTPFDVRSNLLAAYYGETTATMEFPSTSAADYVNGDTDFNQWTMRNINIIGNLTSIKGYFTQSPGRFVGKVNDQYEGNAGTLYLTVNPNTVNFEGVTLNLETSKENAAPIMLSPLQYSDRELTLGYTRSANNGFYEAKATLTEADIDKASLKIDYKTLEEDAKAMLKKKDKASIINFGATLLQNMQDVMPAYGVKASWIDGTEGVTHNLLSEYNLGACAVKPLSFVFMKDYKFTKFPGLDRLQSLVGKVIDKVNIKINLGLPDFSKYKGSITFKDIDIDMSKFTLEYDITKQFSDGTSQKYLVIANEAGEFGLKGPDGKLYVIDEKGALVPASATYERRFNTYTKELKIDFTDEVKDLVNELEDSINEEFGASSDLAKNITSLLNDVASLSKIDTNISKSITDAKNEIKTTINSYITRANNKLTSWMNNAHKALYITLVGGVDKKIGMLSQSVNLPTKVSGELTLVPTSYTLELLAPAYKKYVAVTDVFDSSRNPVDLETAKSMAAAANSGENMNQVFDGEKTCKMNGQSGYIYEITYTAVDFAGKVALKKYYVQF